MEPKSLIVTESTQSQLARELIQTVYQYAEAAMAPNTHRTYSFGWRSFCKWCASRNVDPIKVEDKEALIAFFLSDMAASATLKRASLDCYLAAICSKYSQIGVTVNLKVPALVQVLKGIRRTVPKRPKRKEPILTETIKSMVHAIDSTKLINVRDRAILLLGFAGAFRRSELVGICHEDLKFDRDGIVILIKKSKTDQEGSGMEKAIPYGSNPDTCPVRALNDWIKAAEITEGRIFRSITRHGRIGNRLSPHAVALIIKRNPQLKSKCNDYSGHSLRAGFVTEAAKRNVPEDLIMMQTGHRSSNTVKNYIRRGRAFEENAASMVGL